MLQREVRITNVGIDEDGGDIIFRGRLDARSLDSLLTDNYQRETLSRKTLSSLRSAFMDGDEVPDIVLGMRGQKYDKRGAAIVLQSDVYIIDGLQRVSAARQVLSDNPDTEIRLGAKVYFDTDRDWERNKFAKLNANRVAVSPNVMLRNARNEHRSILTLYGMSHTDEQFPLYRKVCWTQLMQRGELVTAAVVTRVAGRLHAHHGPTRTQKLSIMASALDGVADSVGLQTFRNNMKRFYEVLDECFGLRNVSYVQAAPQLRSTFQLTLARMFCDHEDFWDEKQKALVVESSLRRKIASFPINDPEVRRLAGSSGMARELLYRLLVDHINSGKRTKRLTERAHAHSRKDAA